MKRALAALVLLSACAIEQPVRDRVRLDFTGERVRVTAETSEANRDAVVARRDPWSLRFAKAGADDDAVTFDAHRIEHSASIDREKLPDLFADLPVTVHVAEKELDVYPASSERATAEQREHFERALHFWSERAARYINAMHAVYEYADANPRRAHIVFAALLGNGPDWIITDEEAAVINTAGEASWELERAVRHSSEADAYLLAEEADLIYQPLDFDLRVGTATMPRAKLFDALRGLEGRWLQPDPLAMRLRDEAVSIPRLAGERRYAESFVTPLELEQALIARMKPRSAYTFGTPASPPAGNR